MSLLSHERYCDEIADQVGRLRAVVTSGADLAATVPTCPEWSLEQLLRHMGGVLRWVDTMVRTRAGEELPVESVPLCGGPAAEGDPDALDAWLAGTGELAVAALREAGPDARVWSWDGSCRSGFWARRMTHEITVHRADATLAAGLPYEVAAEVAVDALDEWLEIVMWAQRTGVAQVPRGPYRSIHLHATDTPAGLDAEWLVELGEDGVVWRRGHEKATVALRGPVASLLLAFYGRLPLDRPELEVLGDRRVLEFWAETVRFG